MLEAVNLCKAFDGKPVIRDFSFRFENGGRYCLSGPSGSGKTTLLNLLMGLLKPDGGIVRAPRGLRMSVVFQEDRLLENLTAYGNAALVSRAPQAEVEALLNAMGVEPGSLTQPVGEYSGGMKRRVALCRALMASYDILLLDEPYKGLDADTRERVMRIVCERTRGKTVILVTHDPLEAAGYEVIEV